MRWLRRLAALPGADRAVLVEAAAWLCLLRLGLAILPFRLIAPWLGSYMAESLQTPLAPAEEASVRRISWSIAAAARHLPCKATCLPQALAAHAMLHRRGLSSTIYFGARDAPSTRHGLEFHAWSRTGRLDVTGSELKDTFDFVSCFCFAPSRRKSAPRAAAKP
jgi:hypothetical protein